MSMVTTHVLHTSPGRPAAGVPVRPEHVTSGEPSVVARPSTDERRGFPSPDGSLIGPLDTA